MHIYDYIVIGSGLTGLCIAERLARETSNVLLLEAQDTIGGTNRSAKLAEQTINNGLRYFPATDFSMKVISALESQLEHIVVQSVDENCPQTYEASGFKDFLGFGDKAPAYYDQFSYFLSAKKVNFKYQPHEWIKILSEKYQGATQTKSIVTRFGFEASENEKETTLTHVVVNGTKTFYAHNFIYAGPLKELAVLLPDNIFSQRNKTKIQKATYWQAICVDLFHVQVNENSNLYVLNGTTDDDIGPCVGRFLPQEYTSDGTLIEGQVSQWQSFIDSEDAEDIENIGQVLKKIKRQIKRAFPELAETIQNERIYMSPPIAGGDIKLNANLTLPKVANLWVASPQSSKVQNLMGALFQAQLALASMGFGSVEYTDAVLAASAGSASVSSTLASTPASDILPEEAAL